MNEPIVISQADRKMYDSLPTPISGTISDLAKDPIGYWSSIEIKAQDNLRNCQRPGDVSAWKAISSYAQKQKELYQK